MGVGSAYGYVMAAAVPELLQRSELLVWILFVISRPREVEVGEKGLLMLKRELIVVCHQAFKRVSFFYGRLFVHLYVCTQVLFPNFFCRSWTTSSVARGGLNGRKDLRVHGFCYLTKVWNTVYMVAFIVHGNYSGYTIR